MAGDGGAAAVHLCILAGRPFLTTAYATLIAASDFPLWSLRNIFDFYDFWTADAPQTGIRLLNASSGKYPWIVSPRQRMLPFHTHGATWEKMRPM
jgi:hypothetical protein